MTDSDSGGGTPEPIRRSIELLAQYAFLVGEMKRVSLQIVATRALLESELNQMVELDGEKDRLMQMDLEKLLNNVIEEEKDA